MGVATGLLALALLTLGVFVSFGLDTYGSNAWPDERLSVRIGRHEAEPGRERKSAPQPGDPLSRESVSEPENATVDREAPRVEPSESIPIQRPPVDWNKAITESVIALNGEKRRQEEVKASMWRQTRSVMFQPADDNVPNDPKPLMAELRFRPEIHVVGLGFTVGSCFIGLPLIGVPVEERTVAIRLFVCARDSG